jgi:dienelactone hydrolase
MRRVLLLLLLLPAIARAETAAGWVRLPEPAGLGRLLRPADAVPGALVILLPDATGEDGRAEPYVEALAERRIATLVLGLGEDEDQPARPARDAAAHPEAAAAALAWAARRGFDAARLGLLGFGAGARAALAGPAPAVALYPGCARLPPPAAPAALLVQGAEAPDAAACLALDPPARAERRLLPGLGHGWDVPGALWPVRGPLLPDPAGPGRVQAVTDAQGTYAAASLVAAWLEQRLIGHAPTAQR